MKINKNMLRGEEFKSLIASSECALLQHVYSVDREKSYFSVYNRVAEQEFATSCFDRAITIYNKYVDILDMHSA